MKEPNQILNWNGLYDSSVEEILVDWGKAKVVVKITSAGDSSSGLNNCLLIADNVTLLTCPIKNEWGKSKSINEISQKDNRLEVEMQSGDKIVVEALFFRLEEC